MVLSEEDVATLRADLERVQREKKPLKRKNGNMRRSWKGFGGKDRWPHPSTGKVVVIQLIVEELLLRLLVPCGHVG